MTRLRLLTRSGTAPRGLAAPPLLEDLFDGADVGATDRLVLLLDRLAALLPDVLFPLLPDKDCGALPPDSLLGDGPDATRVAVLPVELLGVLFCDCLVDVEDAFEVLVDPVDEPDVLSELLLLELSSFAMVACFP